MAGSRRVIGSAFGIHRWNRNGPPSRIDDGLRVCAFCARCGDGRRDTSLRDALFLALHTAAPEATRPLLLIFTDGADTSSLLLADEVLESVRDANLVIHAVSFGYQPFLKQATHEAGGRVWSASSDRDLQKLFSRAIRDMRDRYFLA